MSETAGNRALRPMGDRSERLEALQNELAEAHSLLLEAESELASEQAAVNAFRMHCRLKLDTWIEELMTLQTRKQALLTKARLLRHEADELAGSVEDDFWEDVEAEADDLGEELLLPTDVPRDKAAERRLYRELARRFHPDLGSAAVDIAYRTEMMAAVNTAYERRDIQTLYDLADELDPENVAELSGIESPEIRKFRTRIARLKQRERKARRRLKALREENTARLWRKAKQLDREDVHWWGSVRAEIEAANHRLKIDIGKLNGIIERHSEGGRED